MTTPATTWYLSVVQLTLRADEDCCSWRWPHRDNCRRLAIDKRPPGPWLATRAILLLSVGDIAGYTYKDRSKRPCRQLNHELKFLLPDRNFAIILILRCKFSALCMFGLHSWHTKARIYSFRRVYCVYACRDRCCDFHAVRQQGVLIN
jgi:hypothetical protein